MAQPAGDMSRFEELVQGQLATIAARLEDLARRLDEERRMPLRPEDVPGQAELKTALHNLIEHLELAEGRTTEAIGHLRERLEEVARRTQEALQMAENCAGSGESANVRELQERIDALNARLEDIRAAAESSTRAYVDACIGELAGKVEKVQELSARLPQHIGEVVNEQAASAAEARVQQAEERMAAMVARLQNKLEDLAAGAMDVDRLRTDLEQVDGQLQAVREELARKAGADEVEQVREALRQLSARVETKAGREEVDTLRQRLDALAAQLETLHAAGAPADDARVAQLEEQVLSIRNFVEEALGQPLATLDEKLGAHEKRLEEIGRDMGRLQQLEEVIAQLQQALENGAAAQDGGAAAPQDVAALKAGLAEVENFARESDRKTRDMLKAVHETLAEVVERLIALEEGRQKRETPEAAASTASQASLPQEKAPLTGMAEQTANDAAAEDLLAEAAPQQPEQDNAVPTKREEEPQPQAHGDFDPNEIASVIAGLEPQAQQAPATPGAAHGAPGQPAAGLQGMNAHQPEQPVPGQPLFPPADQPGQQPLFSSAPQPGQPDPSPQAGAPVPPEAAPGPEQDFIAAARRAALAAGGAAGTKTEQKFGGLFARLIGKSDTANTAAANATPGTTVAAAPEPAAEREGGLQGLLSGLKGRISGSGENSAENNRKGGSRTRLLLAGLVLLSAAALIMNRFGGAEKPASYAPPAMERQAPADKPAGLKPGPGPKSEVPGKKNANARAGGKRHSALGETAAGSRTAFEDTGMAVTPEASGRAATMITTSSISALGAAATGAKSGGAAVTDNAALPETLGTAALRKAALAGDGKAAFLVGMHYLKGRDVPRDPKAALKWFERAANKGVVVAMYRLGAMYEQGIGVAKDPAKAKAWYERAAQRGNVRAMHNLGVLLASGKVGRPDYAKAAYWFLKAAEHGVRDSQFNLAVLYHRGQGVQRDLAEAWYWYAVAARQGDAVAAEQERKLRPHVDRAKLAIMQKRLQGFRPKPPIRNANVVVIDRPEWRGGGKRVTAAASERRAQLKPLTGKALVTEVQKLLKKMGYDIGAVDGIMGDRTANAIRLFQLQSRLPVNGQPSMEVLERLRAATRGI